MPAATQGDGSFVPGNQATLAGYLRDHDGVYRAHAIQVLTIAASRVTRIASFNDPGLFAIFGLPQVLLPAGDPAAGR
jgi:RNA polymerase sigma-70 factor (ECF subfamily)